MNKATGRSWEEIEKEIFTSEEIAEAELKASIFSKQIRKEIDPSAPLTKEQLKMLEALKYREVTPDEENPELTDKELHKMIKIRKQLNQ